LKLANLNIFLAWLLIPETLAMGWVASAGRLVLELFGVAATEEANSGRIVGAFILLCAVFMIRYLMEHSLPVVGNQNGNGFRLGHRLILAANILAVTLFVFQLGWRLLPNPLLVQVIASFTAAFGYWVMALWAAGFSFVYQSTQIVEPPVA
jgi:hypothetical protein